MIVANLSHPLVICKLIEGDADSLIVQTVVALTTEHDYVVVVDEDIDLLVLMTALSSPSKLHLMKPGKGKSSHFYIPILLA